jgi:hypothetical protein
MPQNLANNSSTIEVADVTKGMLVFFATTQQSFCTILKFFTSGYARLIRVLAATIVPLLILGSIF